MKPIIFLDIDGVLNSTQWMFTDDWKRHEEPWNGHEGPGLPTFSAEAWHLMLDPACVARLKRLVEAVDADIVISSSWRCALDVPQIDECLRMRGLDRPAVGSTPTIGKRGLEILAWLRGAKRSGPFVILDDNSGMDGVEEFWVRTELETGLTDADVDRAIAVIRGQQ